MKPSQQMKSLISKIWGKTKTIVIALLGIIIGISWTYFYIEFTALKAEASQAYEKAVQLREQRIENKKDDASLAPANDPVKPVEEREESKTSSLPLGEIEKMIYEKFGEENYQIARAIAFGESRLNPIATNTNSNGTTDTGIFQINSCHGFSTDELKNPERNIEIAYQLFQKSGFKPWVVYTTGKYKNYL